MVRDYRAWLQSELQLLAGAGSDAFALGQVTMARRALERLDAETGDLVAVELEPEQAQAITAELDTLAKNESLPEPLVTLLSLLTAQTGEESAGD